MHLSAVTITIAAAVQLVLAAPTSSGTSLPEYFQIKSQVLPGQTGKGEFDGLFLSYEGSLTGTEFYPAFQTLNADSLVVQLQPALAAKSPYPALSYLNWNMSSGPTFRAGLEFNEQPYASIEPTAFYSVKKPVKGEVVQNRFYLNQSGSDIFLEWSSNKTAPASQRFRYWIRNAGQKPPFSCAEVNLQVIPIEP